MIFSQKYGMYVAALDGSKTLTTLIGRGVKALAKLPTSAMFMRNMRNWLNSSDLYGIAADQSHEPLEA